MTTTDASLPAAVLEVARLVAATRVALEGALVIAVGQRPPGIDDLALAAALEDLAVVQRRVAGVMGEESTT